MLRFLLVGLVGLLPLGAFAQDSDTDIARTMARSVLDCDGLLADRDVDPRVAAGLCAAIPEAMLALVENSSDDAAYSVLREVFSSNAARALTEDSLRMQVFFDSLEDPETLDSLSAIFVERLPENISRDMLEGITEAVLIEIAAQVYIHYYGEEAAETFRVVADGTLTLLAVAASKSNPAGLILTNVEIWSHNAREMYELGDELRAAEAAGTDLRSALQEAERWRLTYLESLARGYVSGPMADQMVPSGERVELTDRMRAVMEDSLAQMPEIIATLTFAESYISVFEGGLIAWAEFVEGAAEVADVLAGPVADALDEPTPLDAADSTNAFPSDIDVEPFDGFLDPPDIAVWRPGDAWGPGVVGEALDYGACRDQDPVACLRGLGLSDQAATFSAEATELPGGEVAIAFHELGATDLIKTSLPFAPYEGYYLANGPFGNFRPDGQGLAAYGDPTSRSYRQNFPQATIFSSALYTHRLLPDGRQRFVLTEAVHDGCRACPIIGIGMTYIDLGPRSFEVRPIGVHIDPARPNRDLLGQDLVDNPAMLQVILNNRGYEAGEMDGYPGPMTRAALMAFQVEHCLEPTGQPDAATTQALVSADRLRAPCAGEVLPDGIGPLTPLLPGTYIAEGAYCDVPNIPYDVFYDVYRVISSDGGVLEGEEFFCQASRSDIRDGATLMRGDCFEGVTPYESSWLWDVQSNQSYVELGEGGTGLSYSRCDEGTFWGARYMRETVDGSALERLPFPDGTYAIEPRYCDVDPLSLGDAVSRYLTYVEFPLFETGYDVTCAVQEVWQSQGGYTFLTQCNAEGEITTSPLFVGYVGPEAFDLYGDVYTLCQ